MGLIWSHKSITKRLNTSNILNAAIPITCVWQGSQCNYWNLEVLQVLGTWTKISTEKVYLLSIANTPILTKTMENVTFGRFSKVALGGLRDLNLNSRSLKIWPRAHFDTFFQCFFNGFHLFRFCLCRWRLAESVRVDCSSWSSWAVLSLQPQWA